MSGIADLIHQWGRVRLYWPHILWIVLVFILHVQEWWLIYQLKDIEVWRLPAFLFQVLYPISLFILARILFPMSTDKDVADMRMFYLNNYRKLFVMVMMLSSISALENIYIHDLGFEGWIVNAIVFIALLYGCVRKLVTEGMHKFLAIALLLSMIAGIILNINEWLIAA